MSSTESDAQSNVLPGSIFRREVERDIALRPADHPAWRADLSFTHETSVASFSMDSQDTTCSAEYIDILCLTIHVTQWLYLHLIFPNSQCEIIYQIFERPSEWPVNAYFAVQTLLTTHPHCIVHLVAFSILFGPIAALLPLLSLHELLISMVFYLSLMVHGLLPGKVIDFWHTGYRGRDWYLARLTMALSGTTDSRYRLLRATLQDIRESLCHSVDAAGATCNTLTTKYWRLVAVRLCAFAVGGPALYKIWNEKNGGSS
ncbi:hypothetical protein Hypma_012267 [Hypsizygus marmoreus]|uniref:Uncharacterized protein n=1 Tax=Hypsizygus marmoreus TaxID=39966 RepID=A0A369JEM3_HYPMA|nr:hypothetical protein Hypma_012267 [Hypsizygus marmoreus]